MQLNKTNSLFSKTYLRDVKEYHRYLFFFNRLTLKKKKKNTFYIKY